MNKWEWLTIAILGTYLLGVFLSWTHAIAWAFNTDADFIPPAILFGWVWGIFWPLHVTVLLWLNFWF